MRVEPVDAFADLAFHGLAHLPLSGPASLFDPRYVAWSHAALPRDAREPLATDGASIATQLELLGGHEALQWLPRLHPSLGTFDRTALRDLAELNADECDPKALRSLRSIDPRAVEWLRADLLLASASFAVARSLFAREVTDACAAIEDALALATTCALPAVVRVAWALGSHGRGFEDEVVVGASAAWNGLDAVTPAAVALHEHAVVRASGAYAVREWAALCEVSRALDGGPDRLRDAHAGWVAALNLDPLVAEAISLGMVDRETAATILAVPAGRTAVLARLRP